MNPPITLKDLESRSGTVQTTETDIFQRRVKKKRGCLQPCTYVPISMGTLSKLYPPVTDSEAKRIITPPPFTGYLSYGTQIGSGFCDISTSGTGNYDTAAECLAAETVGIPSFFCESDFAFSQSNFYTFSQSVVNQTLFSTSGAEASDVSAGIGAIVRLSGVLPYERDAGGGEFEVVVESGVVPGNMFDLQGVIRTDGTTSPVEVGSPTFDADRYCWVLWEDADNPGTYEFVEFFLSVDILNTAYTFENVSPASSSWTPEGGGTYRYRWFSSDYATIISTSNQGLFFTRTTDAQTPPTSPGNWEFRKSQTSLIFTHSLFRDAFVQAYATLFDVITSFRCLDPITYQVQAGPELSLTLGVSSPNSANAPITEVYLVILGEGIYHVYTKWGKIRNPTVPFNEREWLIITHYEIDCTDENILTTNLPITTVNNYVNPTPVPEILGNPYIERTNSYVHSPTITNPVIAQIDTVFGQQYNKTSCMNFETRTFKEVLPQVDCIGRTRVYKVNGTLVPSLVTCDIQA